MSAQLHTTVKDVLGRYPVHPFPARMAPGIALEIIPTSEERLTVLDPMMGSGTVLAVARSKGHRAIGVDLDPLAVLISKVWTTAIDTAEVREKAVEILCKAHRRYSEIHAVDAFPPSADAETCEFVSYWFDHYTRRQLTALAQAIARIKDRELRDVLWCAFSRLIITKANGASLAMDLSHSRPHKSFKWAPAKPFDNFMAAVEHIIENCIKRSDKLRGPATQTYLGDARKLPIKNQTVDLVLTSPPYLNAIDYMRCSKFSLVWMKSTVRQIREIRSNSVGAELKSAEASEDEMTKQILTDLKLNPKLSARHEAMLARYAMDMQRSVSETARVLKPNGKAVYVVGENTIRGTFVPNSKLIAAVARAAGLKFCSEYSRELPESRRYLPPPAKQADSLNGRMRREVVLTFVK